MQAERSKASTLTSRATMAIRRRVRCPSAHLIGVLVITLTITACNAGADSRFAAAIERIAQNLGRSSGEVEQQFRLKLPNTSIDDLATQAERSATETDVLRQIAATQAAAKAAEQAKTVAAIQEAACDAVGIYSDVSKSTGDRDVAFQQAITDRLREHSLDESSAKVLAVWQAVATQFNSITTNGTFDPDQAAIDFACLV